MTNESTLILFLLEPCEYALSALEVQEVVLLPDLVHVADAPPMLAGVFNLRGEIVTVIDLRRRLGLPERPWTERNAVLVLRWQDRPYGLLVDEAISLMTLRQEEIEASPGILQGRESAPLVVGLGKMNGKVIQILDSAKILYPVAAPHSKEEVR